jgi:hypothetical protein
VTTRDIWATTRDILGVLECWSVGVVAELASGQ